LRFIEYFDSIAQNTDTGARPAVNNDSIWLVVYFRDAGQLGLENNIYAAVRIEHILAGPWLEAKFHVFVAGVRDA
jgi:hypothetical protein